MKLDVKRLEKSREKCGISKKEASRLLGLSQPAYLRYESGDRSPTAPVIKDIARVLHTSVDYLVGETDDPSPNRLELRKDEDKELFQIVEMASDFDLARKRRLLKYTEKLHIQSSEK